MITSVDIDKILTHHEDTKSTKAGVLIILILRVLRASFENTYGGNTRAAKLRNSLARLRERVGVRVPVQRAHHPHLNPLPPKEGEEVKAHPAIFMLRG
jgi:hypothetical protein